MRGEKLGSAAPLGGVSSPKEVRDLLEAVGQAVQEALGPQLIGMYVSGSLALGGFIPETSDVDVMAVTGRALSPGEFDLLAGLHARLGEEPNPYARRVEVAYVDAPALRRYAPGRRHPTLGQGERLIWKEHESNWILERWIVRERCLTLFGPDPQTLIDPVSSAQIVQAARARLTEWASWAAEPDDPEWLPPRSHQAYVVETMCRALFTLAHARLASKPESVSWAVQALPDTWRGLVRQSQAWRTDRTPDTAGVPVVLRFVRWAAAQAGAR